METRDDHKGVNYDDIIPYVHPGEGEVLWAEMKERRISKKTFAEQLGMPRVILNDLLKRKRDFMPKFALKLEGALDIPAKFWTNMQASYWRNVMRIAERDAREAAAATASELAIEYAV